MQKSTSKSNPAAQQLHKSTESMSPTAFGSQVYGKSHFHHPVTSVWAVGGSSLVLALHWRCWGQLRASLLQRKWPAGHRNTLNHNIWTQLQGCCPTTSGERIRQKERGTGISIKKSEFQVNSKQFLVPWAVTSFTRSGCSKPHPTWPWTLPGMGQMSE